MKIYAVAVPLSQSVISSIDGTFCNLVNFSWCCLVYYSIDGVGAGCWLWICLVMLGFFALEVALVCRFLGGGVTRIVAPAYTWFVDPILFCLCCIKAQLR